MVEFVSPALMAEMRDYERTVKRLRKELAEKDKEIERMKTLIADLTLGCMDNVEFTVKEETDG